ncbi:hypothetical protein AHAS_Ahas18G0219600 [Arachis hypogaea]
MNRLKFLLLSSSASTDTTIPNLNQCHSDNDDNCLMQTRKRGRPPKLYVTRARAKGNASLGAVAVSAETIKGSSSATAKKLASFMTFVSTPGFKPPRKKDME